MANSEKTKLASIMQAMKINENNTDTINVGEGEDRIEITVKKKLNLFERADMVKSITSLMWYQHDDGTDVYAPYLRKFAYDFNIIRYFTNIELPDDATEVWRFIDNTDIVNAVVDCVGKEYVWSILREAKEAIEYRKSEILGRSKFERVWDALNNVVKTVNDKVQNLDTNGILEFVEKYVPGFKAQFAKSLQEQVSGEAATEAFASYEATNT